MSKKSKKELFEGRYVIGDWESNTPVDPFLISETKFGTLYLTTRKTENPKAFFGVTIIGKDLRTNGIQLEMEITLISKTGTNLTKARKIKISAYSPSDVLYMGIHYNELRKFIDEKGGLVMEYAIRITSHDATKCPPVFSLNPLDIDYLNKYGPNPVPVVSPEKPPSTAPPASPRRILLDVVDTGRIDCGITTITTTETVNGGFVPTVLQLLYNIPYIRTVFLNIKDLPKGQKLLKEIQKVFAVITNTDKSVICDNVVKALPWKLEKHSPIDFFAEIVDALSKSYGVNIFTKILPTFILNNRDAETMEEAIQLTSPPNVYPDVLPIWPMKQRSKKPFKYTERITVGPQLVYVLHEVYIQDDDEYVAFIRPTIDGDWAEVRGREVTRASDSQVFDDNFRKKLLCLVYVKESVREALFDETNANIVDKQLLEIATAQMQDTLTTLYERSMARRTTEFVYFTEETLRFLVRSNKAGFQAVETAHKVKLDVSSSTAQIYYDVADDIGIEVDKIRLWIITPDERLVQVPLRDDANFMAVPTRKLFVQTKKLIEPLEVPDDFFLAFVKYFDPTDRVQLMTYVGSVILSPDQPMEQFTQAVAQGLGFKPNTPLIAFNERTLEPLVPTARIGAQPLQSTDTLVFQADPEVSFPIPKIPDSQRKCLDCRTELPRFPSATTIPVNPLRLIGELPDVQTYQEYKQELERNLQVLAFNYDDYRVSPILLSLPDTLHFSQLEKAIVRVAKLKVNKQKDVVLFFASDHEAGDIPQKQPLPFGQSYKRSMLNQRHPVLFYLLEKDPPADRDYMRSRTVHVKISADSVNITEQYSFFINPDITVGGVIEKLKAKGFKEKNMRCLAETSGYLSHSYKNKSEKLVQTDHTCLRIDFIPPGKESSLVIQVNFARLDQDGYAHTEGTPFYLEIKSSDTVATVRDNIREKTKMEKKRSDKLRFALGKPLSKILANAILKENNNIEQCLKQNNYDINDIAILAIKQQPYTE